MLQGGREDIAEELRRRLGAIEAQLSLLTGSLGRQPLAQEACTLPGHVPDATLPGVCLSADMAHKVELGHKGMKVGIAEERVKEENTGGGGGGTKCSCGNTFKEDSQFCRQCGKTRLPASAWRENWPSKAMDAEVSWTNYRGQKTTVTTIDVVHKSLWSGLSGPLAKCLRRWDDNTKKERSKARSKLYDFVHSERFEIVSCSFIGLHSFLVGLTSGLRLRENASRSNEYDSDWVPYAEVVFCIIFSFELVLRVVGERWLFIFGESLGWNVLDSVLNFLSVVDMVINGVAGGSGLALQTARLLRLTRMFRIIRAIRLLKYFGSLRLITQSLVGSFGTLASIAGILFVLTYVCANVFAHMASEHLTLVGGVGGDDAVSVMLRDHYPGFFEVTQMLYMCITGGVSWIEVYQQWFALSPLLGMLLEMYIFVMYFGVLNVVTSFFVNSAARLMANDREEIIKNEIMEMEDYMKKAELFFRGLDEDGSGNISWETFRKNLEDVQVKASFQSLDLDIHHAADFFSMLDADKSDEVSLNEFIEGCLRLRGDARCIDVNMVLLYIRRLFTQVEVLQKDCKRQFQLVNQAQARSRS